MSCQRADRLSVIYDREGKHTHRHADGEYYFGRCCADLVAESLGAASFGKRSSSQDLGQ